VSLNLHIKLKHNGGNKTDREKAAVFYSLKVGTYLASKIKRQTSPTILHQFTSRIRWRVWNNDQQNPERIQSAWKSM